MAGFARKGRKSRTVHCPVYPRTEDKNGLPNGVQTAPSCLGAIKGTPKRMEENTKHPLNILRRWDLAFTHLVHCNKDSSTSLSCNSTVLSSCARSCLVCMLLLQLSLLCVLLFPLTLVLIRDHLCNAWETPKCGDSSQRDIVEIKRTVVFKLIFGSLERGWVQPSSVVTPQRGIGKYSTWSNHGIKFVVSLVFILVRFSLPPFTSLA
jgi:hypothetical protein